MLTKVAIVFAACVVGYLAQEDNDLKFRFAAEAETYLYQPLSLDFSCEGRPYGYFADIANSCQVFHICLPIEDDFGSITETLHWSFLCGNQTVFDQSTLTCNHIADSIDCGDSEQFYNIVPFGEEDAPAFGDVL